MSILPTITGESEYSVILRDPDVWCTAVIEICRRHGIACDSPERYSNGSTIVASSGGGEVVKIFPPYALEHRTTEATVLGAIAGGLPLRTPELIAEGELDGWPYLIMSQLSGVLLDDFWEQIPVPDRIGIAGHLGRALCALHSLPTGGLGDIGVPWEPFIAMQAERCFDRQREKGVAEEWLRQIPEFLASVELPLSGPPVLLHTEVMRDHLLAIPEPSGWRLSGLLDFEPAMLGNREYEFSSVGLFFSRGDATLLRPLLLAYGYHPDDLGADLSRRFMAYTLLHRYGNLQWYLDTVPSGGSRTFNELADAWWGF